MKNTISPGRQYYIAWRIGWLVLSIFFILVLHTSAYAATYYFNNAVNTDPAELGNYWNDSGDRGGSPVDPALQLPDTSVDEITILAGATYTGDAVFNGSAENRGEVDGNAVFNGDLTENDGVVTGTRTRHYTESIDTVRNFTLTNTESTPWNVVADGAVVNVKNATADPTNAIFSTLNGGSFVDLTFLYSSVTDDVVKVVYDGTLDPVSISNTTDYEIRVNDTVDQVTQVTITGNTVLLTLDTPVHSTDTVFLTYSIGTTPIKSNKEVDVPALNDIYIAYAIPTDAAPYYLTVVGNKIYTSNLNGNTISVVDIPSSSVSASIPVGQTPFYSVALGNKVFVSNTQDTTISVIDTTTDTVVDTIEVGTSPGYIVTANNKIYATLLNLNLVAVIDSNTNAVIQTIPTGANSGYLTVVGAKIYVSNSDGTLTVIHTADDSVTTISGIADQALYAVNVGTKLYINCAGTISVVDTITDTFITNIAASDGAYSFSVVGTKLYVTGLDYTTTVIDTITDTAIHTITVGFQSYFSTYFNKRLYVSNNADNTVTVIDTETDQVLETLYVGKNTYHFAVIGNYVYVVANNSNYISIINTDTIPSQLPNLVSFSTSTSSGTYTEGQSINITAHFGRTLQSGSTMTVLLNTGRSITLNQVSGNTLNGTYVIQTGDTTPDLAIKSITSASVSDTNGHSRTSYEPPSSQGTFTAENSFITRNLGDTKNIQIGNYQSFATGDHPYQISVPINGFLYVANQGAGTVSVINATTGALTDTISVGSEPYGLVVNGTELYVANTGSDTVSVIDTTTNTVTDTISVGIKPYYVATIGTNVYVTNGGSNTVSVISALSHSVSNTIPVGAYPRGIKAHGTDLYVANYGDPNYSGGNYISVISSLTNTVIDTIILPAGSDGPRGVTVDGTKVYVANFRSNNVSVIDTASNTITATIPVGMGPRGIVGLGTNIYVENFDDGTISMIDTTTNTVTSTIDVGHSPAGMIVVGTDIYLTSFQDDKVYILDTVTNTLRTTAAPTTPAPSTATTTSRGPSGSYARGPIIIQTPSIPSSPIVSPFTRDLKLNMIGTDVKTLQVFLNTHGFIVASSGAGSPGKETTKFGSLTKKALIKFQRAYKITPAIGYFGKITRGVVSGIK